MDVQEQFGGLHEEVGIAINMLAKVHLHWEDELSICLHAVAGRWGYENRGCSFEEYYALRGTFMEMFERVTALEEGAIEPEVFQTIFVTKMFVDLDWKTRPVEVERAHRSVDVIHALRLGQRGEFPYEETLRVRQAKRW